MQVFDIDIYKAKDFDIFIKKLFTKDKVQVTDIVVKYLFTEEIGNIVIFYNAKIVLPSLEAEITLTFPKEQENNIFKHPFKLTIESTNDTVEKKVSDVIQEELFHKLPEKIYSMEHFNLITPLPVSFVIAYLKPILIPNALKVVRGFMKEYEEIGVIEYKTDPKKFHVKIRQKISEDNIIYFSIYNYILFKINNKFLCAIGIEQEDNLLGETGRLYLKLIVSRHLEEKMLDKFSSDFDKLLTQSASIKGAKITGSGEMIKLKTKINFEDIVLENKIRDAIKKEIINFFNMERIYKEAGLPFRRGIALYGPMGTGKTMLAKYIVSNFKQTVIWAQAGDLNSIADIKNVFYLARAGSPSVLILEDIDFYTKSRERADSNDMSLATIMSELDGLEENEGILVIVTTNRIEAIEKAIIERPGRIDDRIFVGELGKDKIAKIFSKKLGKFKRDFRSFLDVIPDHTVMSGALATEFSMRVLRFAVKNTDNPSQIFIKKDYMKKTFHWLSRIQNNRQVGF